MQMPSIRAATAPRLGLATILILVGLGLTGQSIYMSLKALLAQVLLERAFAASLAKGHDVKPWSWADTWPVARIVVPRLGASAIALYGASGQALAFGPGHVEGTPAAGEPGTAVFAAHRDTHFSFLRDVRLGDRIQVTNRDGRSRTFHVTRTAVVDWNASGIDPAAPGRRIVLATCWPFDARAPGPDRFIVEAREADLDPAYRPREPRPNSPRTDATRGSVPR